jgi:putative transposase
MEAYSIITDYMEYYNQRRRHGSINFMASNRFYEAFMSNAAKIESFSV